MNADEESISSNANILVCNSQRRSFELHKKEIMKKITVNDNIIDWEEDMTITRILKIMNYTFRMLVVKVNGKLVKKVDYASTIVPPDADVKVIHLISGG